HRNLLIDSTIGGFWIAAMGFNLLPSSLIVTMLCMSNMAVGGWRLFVKGVPALALGALLALALLRVRFQAVPELAVVLACIPFMVIYPLLIGMVTWRLSLKLSQQREALRILHEHDSLSGLYSRAYWDTRLQQEFQRFGRYKRPVTLMLMDIDHFKAINDTHGHTAGDDAIRRVGALLLEHVRPEDLVGRYGGEEFAAILPETTASQARVLAERIRGALAATVMPIGGGVRLTMSFGIAELSPDVRDCLVWIERADRALYEAKDGGRNQVRVSCEPAQPG
ncbi:MAG: diguanylate cyclase, partial [Gammaproteobacteria bacterium]